MTDIFREIEEEVRKDRYLNLWKKYGIYVIGLCVALVVGTAAMVGWREYRQAQSLEESTRFLAAVQQLAAGETAQAREALETLAQHAGSGYALVAKLRAAAVKAEAGNREAALADYDALAASDAPQVYRDLARLLGALLVVDTASSAELQQRLQGLLEQQSPWRFSAREILALAAYREGQQQEAREQFRALAEDPEAPNGVGSRARQMLTALGGGT